MTCVWEDSPESTCYVPWADDPTPDADVASTFDPDELCDSCRERFEAAVGERCIHYAGFEYFRTRLATWATDLPEGSKVVEVWGYDDKPEWLAFAWLIDGRLRPWKSSRVSVDLVESAKMAVEDRP